MNKKNIYKCILCNSNELIFELNVRDNEAKHIYKCKKCHDKNEDHKIIITGRSSGNFLEEKIEFLKLDLNVSTKEEFFKLISQNNGFDGVTFSQRYRPSNEIREYLKEIKIMVVAIAYFMEALREYNLSKQGNAKFTRIIVVGSNYSSKVGKDQGWEYHAVKSAQLSLVKYFSVNSDNFYI